MNAIVLCFSFVLYFSIVLVKIELNKFWWFFVWNNCYFGKIQYIYFFSGNEKNSKDFPPWNFPGIYTTIFSKKTKIMKIYSGVRYTKRPKNLKNSLSLFLIHLKCLHARNKLFSTYKTWELEYLFILRNRILKVRDSCHTQRLKLYPARNWIWHYVKCSDNLRKNYRISTWIGPWTPNHLNMSTNCS